MAKANYKFYANNVASAKNTRHFRATLDTSTGSSFIRFNELQTALRDLIKPLDSSVIIRNPKGKEGSYHWDH